MKWQFNVPNGSASIALNAELICRTHQMEQIKVTGKNISVIILGNRPLIEGIERPHHIPISWSIFGGELKDEKLFNAIAKNVEQHIVQNTSNKHINMYQNTARKTA